MHIDWWTLALQTVNVLILIWILGRFFFRPVADLVAKRKEATSKVLADAEAARKEAGDARAEASRLRATIDTERDRLMAEARSTAQAETAALVAQSAQELEKRRSEATAAIERERAAAQRAVIEHASELSIEIARRLLERIAAGVAFSAFLDGLERELRALPPREREQLSTAHADHPLQVASATALTDDQEAELRRVLRAALGAEPAFRLSVDPKLIAGFDLSGPNFIVRNNWQADLARIRGELGDDRQR
jgi:F-type H+-transporting ATPase subunit b